MDCEQLIPTQGEVVCYLLFPEERGTWLGDEKLQGAEGVTQSHIWQHLQTCQSCLNLSPAPRLTNRKLLARLHLTLRLLTEEPAPKKL